MKAEGAEGAVRPVGTSSSRVRSLPRLGVPSHGHRIIAHPAAVARQFTPPRVHRPPRDAPVLEPAVHDVKLRTGHLDTAFE
jgi:hypothetical protein